MSEAKFDLEIQDGRIIIRPLDNYGRKYKPMSLSIETAASLAEAIRQTVEVARLKWFN